MGDTAHDHFSRLAASGLAPDAYRREEAWIAHETAPYLPPSDRRLKVLPDGRHLLIECGRRTEGGHLVTVADVTDLVAARDRAEALSAERSEMLAVIGHELRTPISALVGALDLAADLTGATADDGTCTACAAASPDSSYASAAAWLAVLSEIAES